MVSKKLKITAGPGYDANTHTIVDVNRPESPVSIQSDVFEGKITVRIKDFSGIAVQGKELKSQNDYFEGTKDTSSIQVCDKCNLSSSAVHSREIIPAMISYLAWTLMSL